MQSFESLLEESKQGQLSVDTSWGQGRTLFGGLSGALGLERTKLMLADQLVTNPLAGTSEAQTIAQRPLRSIAVNFSGQCLAETNISFQESLLSHGKSISQINAQVLQNDRIVTQVSACYGIERESTIEVPSPNIALPKLGSHQRLNYIKGFTPEFVQHFEFEYCQGQFPFSNSEKNELAGWMRFKESGKSFTDSHLLALIDAWPPTVLQKLKTPAPCASVSWNLEIVQPLALLKNPLKSDTWLYYEAKIKQAHHGYAHTEASIYTPEGTLLALSRQLIAVYA
jgi:acyl-CoA thioesterase